MIVIINKQFLFRSQLFGKLAMHHQNPSITHYCKHQLYKSKYNTPEKHNIELDVSITSKKHRNKVANKYKPAKLKNQEEETINYGQMIKTSKQSLEQIEQDHNKYQKRRNKHRINSNLQQLISEKDKNFQIISRTLHKYIQIQFNDTQSKQRRKTSIKKKQTILQNKLTFILKFLKAFNETQIKQTSPSMNNFIDQIISNFNKVIAQKQIKQQHHIHFQRQKGTKSQNSKRKRNVVYSRVVETPTQSIYHKKRQFNRNQAKTCFNKLIQIESEVMEKRKQLQDLKQQGKVLQRISFQLQDYDKQQKQQIIEQLYRKLQEQQELLRQLDQDIQS